MKNILVILAHPDFEKSYANRIIVNMLKKESNITIRDLGRLYPDFKIDVTAEQNALLNADMVIFQYPLYWYSVPPILKQWMDKVLTYGFAFGKEGDKLQDKELWISVTIGGPESSYSNEGYNNYNLKELLYPMYQTANHCKTKLTQIIASYKMEYIPNVQNNLTEVESKAQKHVNRLLTLIKELTQENTMPNTGNRCATR